MSAEVRPRVVLPAVVGLFVAAIILYLAIPRTIAAFILYPETATLRQIQNGNPVDAYGMGGLARSRRAAMAWVDDGRIRTDLALAELLMAEAKGNGSQRDPALVAAAITAASEGLARAPLNPQAWARLAYARYLRNGPTRGVATDLRMSIFTGPYEPRLVFSRLALSLRDWQNFAKEDRDLLLGQVRFAWDVSPDKLIRVTEETGAIGIVLIALARNPADLKKFVALLRSPKPYSTD